MLLDYMEKLKEIILSDQSYEIKENIYKKRHITIDIPSMYGSYHEMKFDCLGLMFRFETLVNVLFEGLIEKINLSLITKSTFHQIYSLLRLFDRALKLDGISSKEFERQLEFLAHSLEVKGFTLTQYLDIFKGFAQAVKNVVNDYFNNIHGQNLTRIFVQIRPETLLPKFLPRDETIDSEKVQLRVSEIFFRDRIAIGLGLQQLDLFLSRILSTLFQQSYKLPKDKLQRLLLYDPQNSITPIDSSLARLTGIIYLGNKGLNMVRLKSFGYPIPPGFIITTEVFRCREIIESYPPAEQNFVIHFRYAADHHLGIFVVDGAARWTHMAWAIITGRGPQFYGISAVATKFHHHMPIDLAFAINIQLQIFGSNSVTGNIGMLENWNIDIRRIGSTFL